MDINANIKRQLAGFTCLIVEDDPACLQLFKHMLESEGACVHTAKSLSESRQRLSTLTVDAVITDIQLPDGSGIEVLKTVRSTSATLPVIIITGYGSVNSASDALRLGAQDYLIKPIETPDRLTTPVKHAIDAHVMTQRNARLQKELAISEQRYRAVFENVNDAILILSRTHGDHDRIIEANETLCEWTGLTLSDLKQLPFGSFLPASTRGPIVSQFRELEDTEQIELETRLASPGGRSRPVAVHAHLFHLDNHPVVLVVLNDLSNRRHMERQITRACEKEQCRIGNELHDTLCQSLTSIELLARVVSTAPEVAGTEVEHDATLLENVSCEAATQARLMAQGLFPVHLEQAGLLHELKLLAKSTKQLHGIECHLTVHGTIEAQDHNVELNIYRIAQESLHNAIRHGDATDVTLELLTKHDECVLNISDNGTGRINQLDSEDGMGISVMRYRASVSNGHLSITDNTPTGLCVTCTWSPESPSLITATPIS